MSDCVIRTEDLTKTFTGLTAVNGLDLSVPQGSILGFLGPNGAGKTTTIRMLMGHLHASEGIVEILGQTPWRLSQKDRARVAYVSENMNLPGWMTPEAACAFNASFYEKWEQNRAEDLLRKLDLSNTGSYAALSKGQKRALCLILALCVQADLLVLDEPAAGLDVAARRLFLDTLLEINREHGSTVFFSSHLLTDIERVVDHVVILKKGRMALSGELDSLKETVRMLHVPLSLTKEMLEEHFTVAGYQVMRDSCDATILDFTEDRLHAFNARNPEYTGIEAHGLNLEDLFVQIVQQDEDGSPAGRDEKGVA